MSDKDRGKTFVSGDASALQIAHTALKQIRDVSIDDVVGGKLVNDTAAERDQMREIATEACYAIAALEHE